jgi:uncharacterized membrane protein YfcA
LSGMRLPLFPATVSLGPFAVSALTIWAAALVQGTIGFGFAILSVPVMALADPQLAPVPQLLLVAPLTISMWWRERSDTDWRGIGWVLLGRLPGAGIGVLALKLANAQTLQLLVAGCVLAGVCALASGRELPRTPATQLAAGMTSAIFAVISSIGGPPLALLYRDAHAAALRASLATIFSIGVVVTIAARLLAGAIVLRDLQLALWLSPALLLGFAVSRLAIRRLGPQASLRKPVLVVSALAGVGVVLRALWPR